MTQSRTDDRRGTEGSSCVLVLALLAALFGTDRQTAGQETDPSRTSLAGEVDLSRLVDLSAERLGLRIQYDAGILRGATVTLRLGAPVSDEQLWQLTNQLLVSQDLTSVQMPGDDVLSIVKLTDAPVRARIEPSVPPTTRAGFATVMLVIENRSVEDVVARHLDARGIIASFVTCVKC